MKAASQLQDSHKKWCNKTDGWMDVPIQNPIQKNPVWRQAGRFFNGLGFLAGFQHHLFTSSSSLFLSLSPSRTWNCPKRDMKYCVCCFGGFLCVCLFPYTWVHTQRDPLEYSSASRHWQTQILIWNSLKGKWFRTLMFGVFAATLNSPAVADARCCFAVGHFIYKIRAQTQ